MPDTPKQDDAFAPVDVRLRNPTVAALLAWLWPGAGHIYQGRYGKGVLFMVCILAIYFFGLAVGGGHVVYASFRKPDVRYPYLAQVCVGLPALPAIPQNWLVMDGKEHPSPYRDGQYVIKDSGTGAIVYMPPEAKDVPVLMNSLVKWIHHQKEELPVPIVAAIAHYQFATIHPYYDGNGRTARLLTNIVLHKSGYGLKGIYSLEEYYAGDLQAYYAALDVGDSHNYYTGRAEGDVTPWLLYFCSGMANAFANVRLQLAAASTHLQQDHSALLRELDQRQKRVMSLFKKSKFITTREIATLLKIHPRTALNLCKKWLAGEFIIQHGAANKNRKYELAERWLELI